MWRLLTTYRWELWLLLGIPVFSLMALDTVYSLWGFPLLVWWPLAIWSLPTAVLLGVSYLRVKRLGRDFLTLVWGYALAVAVIPAVARVVCGIWPIDSGAPLSNILWYAMLSSDAFHMTLVASVEVAVLPVLIVFARRASRFSLAHAYFLFFITEHYFSPSSPFPSSPLGLASSPTWFVTHSIYLVLTLVLVWLLGNFESRGPRFHWRATAALAAGWVLLPIADRLRFGARGLEAVVEVLGSPIWILSFLLLTFLPIAVIYLVRARDPKGAAPPAPAET